MASLHFTSIYYLHVDKYCVRVKTTTLQEIVLDRT